MIGRPTQREEIRENPSDQLIGDFRREAYAAPVPKRSAWRGSSHLLGLLLDQAKSVQVAPELGQRVPGFTPSSVCRLSTGERPQAAHAKTGELAFTQLMMR
jgi:hypothetical protein